MSHYNRLNDIVKRRKSALYIAPNSRLSVLTCIVKNVLLRKPGIVSERRGIEIFWEMRLERAAYPHVNREGLKMLQPEEHHAVCNLLAHALEF